MLAVTVASGTSVRADVRVEGEVTGIRLDASHAPLAEVFSALEAAFDVRYRTSIPIDREIHGTYTGNLAQVISRVLDGYNYYVVRKDERAIEVVVLGRPSQRAGAQTPKASSPEQSAAKPAKAAPARTAAHERQRARHRRPPAQRP